MATKTMYFSDSTTSVYGRNRTETRKLPDDFSKVISISNGTYEIKDGSITVSYYLNQSTSYAVQVPYEETTYVWGDSFTVYDAENHPFYDERVISKQATSTPGVYKWTLQIREAKTETKYKTEYRSRYEGSTTVTYSTNEAPSAPSYISTSGNVHVDAPITVTWGTATDPDGDQVTYELYVSYSGSNVKTKLYEGPLSTYQYTLPDSISSVKFFVRATDGDEFTDYKETETIPVSQNASPTITGSDQTVPIVEGKIEYVYQVSDPEGDSVTITESINGVQLRKMVNASQNTDLMLQVSADRILALPVGQENSIVIEAMDEKGQSSFRRLTFIKTNSPPAITYKGKEDLGEIETPPTIEASFTDPDNDPIVISVEVDGKEIHKEEAIGSKEFSYTLPKDVFLKIRPRKATSIILRVKDSQGETATRKITFYRVTNRIEIKGKHISKDFANGINKVFITVRWSLDEGAIPTVKLCNNALDDNPTWEDFTKQVLERADCVFQNTKTTNGQWALGIWVTVERGTSDGTSFISSIGGALK